MTKHVLPLLAAAAVLVAGCGTAGAPAVDGADGTTAATPRSTPDPHPTHAATWPAYDVADYTYTLRAMCFCVDRGVPVVVTVRDGQAVDAVYAHPGWGHAAGAHAGSWLRLSINDVIDAANTRHAYQVRVVWPKGQDHPTSVYVDQDANTADEEIGYSVHDVTPD